MNNTANHFFRLEYDYPRTTGRQEYKKISRFLRVSRNIVERNVNPDEVISELSLMTRDMMLFGVGVCRIDEKGVKNIPVLED